MEPDERPAQRAGRPHLIVTVENSPGSTQTITQVSFACFDASLIPDRNETVTVGPNQSVSFEFDQNQAEELFDPTLTWSDLSTSPVQLFPFVSGGGNRSFPVSK